MSRLLQPADPALSAMLAGIEYQVQQQIWSRSDRFRKLTVHGLDESYAICQAMRHISDVLPASLALTDEECFTLSGAALLANVGLCFPDLSAIGISTQPHRLTDDDLALIWRCHPQLSAEMVLRSAVRDQHFPSLGLADSPYAAPIALLCQSHEGADLPDLRTARWPELGTLRMDLMAALLAIASVLELNRQRVHVSRILKLQPQYQAQWWPLLYYRGALIDADLGIQLLFTIPSHAMPFEAQLRAAVENPIRKCVKQALSKLHRYGLQMQFHDSRADLGGPRDIIPTGVRKALLNLEQELIELETPALTSPSSPPGAVPLQLKQETRRELREFINQRFGISEIRDLCFDFGIEFDNLEGSGKKVPALIEYAEHHGMLRDLLMRLRDDRPDLFSASPLVSLVVPDAELHRNRSVTSAVSYGPLTPGTVLPGNDRYVITEVLSTPKTSNSFVYKAEDRKIGKRPVVIKDPAFFYEDVRLDTVSRVRLARRYQREVHILSTLHHDGIASIVDFVNERYLIQEWVEGLSLRDLLCRHTPLDIETVLIVAREACEAMRYAYNERRVVHRDLKPEHIFWLPSSHICIIDFGLAQAADLSGAKLLLPATGEEPVGGTLLYMAPEQGMVGGVDHRADIFSLAVTLFECLTGRLPYPRGAWSTHLYTNHELPPVPSLESARSDVPLSVAHAIRQALAPRPDDRFTTWEAFAEALMR